jgi:ribonuclease R
LMLLANICAAELLISSKIPAIYRVHPKPDFAQIKQLEGFLRSRNLNIKLSETAKVKEFADILMQVKDRNDSEILSMGMLQNLNLAIYQREPKEHFALAYNSYTHFTSPIRRYPDLMVHRAIKSLIKNNQKKEISIKDNNEGLIFESYDYSKEQIDEITASCSEKEIIAESASRDSFDTLRCELASKHIGKIFKGKVSHIAEFGVFVKIEKLNIEGLCHVKNLPGNDYYLYDPITKSLTTRYSKKGFYLGDSMQIKIKQVETLNQRIDLEIVK